MKLLPAGTLVAAVCLVVFTQTYGHEFLTYDDPVYLSDNAYTVRGLTWDGVIWAFTNIEFNWHPLTWISHMLDVQLFGLSPGPHHLMSVAWHLATSFALLAFLVRMTGRVGVSTFIAVVFVVHPLHVETVAWASARKDLINAFFWILGMIAYLRYVERPSPWRWWPVPVAMSVSLMAKGMSITFPFLLLLLDWWPLRRFEQPGISPWKSLTSLLIEKRLLFTLSIIGSVIQIAAQRAVDAITPLHAWPPSFRISNAIVTYVRYVGRTIWPANLALPYPLHYELPPIWEILLASIFLVVVSVTTLRLRHSRPHIFVGWFWYVISVTPVVGFVQLGHQSSADRYMYVPMIGLLLALVGEVAERTRLRPSLRPFAFLAGALVLLVLTRVAFRQTSYWQNQYTLFMRATEVTERNYLAYMKAGAYLAERGDAEAGMDLIRRSLEIQPGYSAALVTLSGILGERGDVETAEAYARQAIANEPRNPDAYFNLGLMRLRQNDFTEAEMNFLENIRLRPRKAEAHLGLAEVYARTGRPNEAERAFASAGLLRPGWATPHLRRGQILQGLNRSEEAQREFHAVLDRDPTNTVARAALQRTYE